VARRLWGARAGLIVARVLRANCINMTHACVSRMYA
jgi:hypothetical protein